MEVNSRGGVEVHGRGGVSKWSCKVEVLSGGARNTASRTRYGKSLQNSTDKTLNISTYTMCKKCKKNVQKCQNLHEKRNKNFENRIKKMKICTTVKNLHTRRDR